MAGLVGWAFHWQSSAPVKQPMFQVPVTLPFVMQRPQKNAAPNGKPTSYLRPVGVMVDPISQDEPVQPVQPVQPVRQTKPWYANLPQEEDLSSAPVNQNLRLLSIKSQANLII